MTREILLTSIAEQIGDFRRGEIEQITPNHVERWVQQFNTSDQETILREMQHILERFYLSKEAVTECIRDFLTAEQVFGDNPRELIASINFLNIQTNGKSQSDMLEIVEGILQEEYNLKLAECGGSDAYLYIDDCIYTGNRFRYDLVPWINDSNIRPDSKVLTYHIAHHSSGYDYAYKHIRKAAEAKNVNVSCWRSKVFNSYKTSYGSNLEVMWPFMYTEDDNVNDYYKGLVERCAPNSWRDKAFRYNSLDDERLFTNATARDVVEREFLKGGAMLVLAAERPSESMRPLGFEKLESLGFGSVFVTYRNISNNCPLVLWYGDPNSFGVGALGMWYPLFPRKTNESTFNWEDLF